MVEFILFFPFNYEKTVSNNRGGFLLGSLSKEEIELKGIHYGGFFFSLLDLGYLLNGKLYLVEKLRTHRMWDNDLNFPL